VELVKYSRFKKKYLKKLWKLCVGCDCVYSTPWF